MSEQWRRVPGFELTYEVSNLGNVRRIERKTLKPDRDKDGYLRVALGYKGRGLRVHRLVAAAFIGPCPPGYEVNHRDGHKDHNKPENLEYCTSSEHKQHAFDVLGQPPRHRGENTHFATLTDNDVIQIRRLRREGLTYAAISARFNTKPANVWHICVGHTWKHLL